MAEKLSVEIADWKPMERGTLLGFVAVRIPAMRLTIRDCTVNENNGRRWVGLPGKAQIDGNRELGRPPQEWSALRYGFRAYGGRTDGNEAA